MAHLIRQKSMFQYWRNGSWAVSRQREGGFVPDYDVAATAREMKAIMESLKIEDYRIRIPALSGSENINYDVWIEFRKSGLK